MTRSFSVSSSRPNASACSGVIVMALPATVFWIVLGPAAVVTAMTSPFRSASGCERDVAVAYGDGHTDLHVLLFGARHRPGDDVFHRAAGLAAGAAVADAHPAATFGGQARGLRLLQ